MKILGISGSLRKHSLNTWLLNAAREFITNENQFTMIAIDNLAHYNEDHDNEKKPESVASFLNQVDESDILLIASPEYNHSMSGVLKNSIDWASRPAFKSPLLNKPCGILTASKSSVGGARAQADLKNVLSSTLSLIYPTNEYLLANAHEKFDNGGRLTDADARRRLERYVEGLIRWARQN